MKIAVFGSWREDDRDFTYRGSREDFEKACQEIGKELARKHQQIIAYSASTNAADSHIVKGVVETVGQMWEGSPLIHINTRKKKDRPFESYATQYPKLFRYYPQVYGWGAAAQLISVRKADVVLTIGGHTSTYDAGLASIVARKPVVPIASFGGASAKLFDDVTNLGEVENVTDLETLNGPWTPHVRDAVLRLLGVDQSSQSTPKVFLGYCSLARATATEITAFLEHTLKVTVCNYAMDFVAGRSILEEIEKASRECTCGVFLFTKDDPLGSSEQQAAPRDNVVFEAGYFMHAKGKERTLIIREEGAKLPADLGGNIYLHLKNRNDISTIHTNLRSFLEERLQ